MAKFMVVHRDPDISWDKVEENWIKLAHIESATWERTWFNRKQGVRHCLWQASDADVLKKVFADLDISWEYIIEVEETVPDIWKSFRYERSPFPGQTRLR